MNKKFFSILSVIIIIILLLFLLSPTIYAGGVSTGQLQSQAQGFLNQGQANSKIDVNKIAEIIKPLASLLLGIGTVVLVVVTAIMGVKYMAANPEERGKLKTQLLGIAVSAIVLFGAYGIWSIAYAIMSGLTT